MKNVIVLIIATVFLTACGSKKNAELQGTPPPPAETPASEVDKPGTKPDAKNPSGPSRDHRPEDGNINMKPPKNPGDAPADNKPSTPEHNDNGHDDDDKPEGPTGSLPVVPAQPVNPQKPEAPQKPGEHKPSHGNSVYNPAVPNFSEPAGGKKGTGAASSSGMIYTGSSADNLLNFLRARNATVAEDQQKANLSAAAQIVSADLTIDRSSNRAYVSMQVVESSAINNYILVGNLSSAAAQPIRIVQNGTTGKQIVSGTLKCIDREAMKNNKCKTAVARMAFGPEGKTSIAYVVLRQNYADMQVIFPKDSEYSESRNMQKLIQMVQNTLEKSGSKERFDDFYFHSFEVVHGRAGFKIQSRANNDEFVGFKGALIAADAPTTKVNLPVAVLDNESEISADLLQNARLRFNLLESFSSVKMINNNSLGQIRLQIQFGDKNSSKADKFQMVFMRQIEAIQNLDTNLMK